MNKRMLELAKQAGGFVDLNQHVGGEKGCMVYTYDGLEKFAELIVEECAKELREAEQEADRAYKATEVKERMVFDGYDFAEMLEERFGVEE